MAEQPTELENHVEFQPNMVPENPVSLLKSMQIDQPLALMVQKLKKDNSQNDMAEDNKYIFLR